MTETLLLPDPVGDITLTRKRHVKRLTLRIRQEDGSITVTAPNRVPTAEIVDFVAGKADWIASRRAALPQPVDIRPGAEIPILGKRLRLTETDGRRIVRQEDTLALPGEGERYAAHLRGYLKTLARDRLTAASDHYAAQIGKSYARITLRDTRSRWGSCSSGRALMYSWRLVMAPEAVLDYVAAHEVAHLAEMNHGPRYWALVRQINPAFETHRTWLRTHGTELHRYRF